MEDSKCRSCRVTTTAISYTTQPVGSGLIEPPSRLFPPPWSAEESDACYIVRHANGFPGRVDLFRGRPGRRTAAKLLTRDKAWTKERPGALL